MKVLSAGLASFILLAIAAGDARQAGDQPIRFLRAIPLPHVEGRIDHLAYDPDGQRLFVAALGNDTVEVIDVAAGTHLKTIPGFHEPQGIAVATDAKVVAVANGRGEGLQFIAASDHRPGAAVMLGDDADNVRYDRDARTLYVGYGSGAIAAVAPSDGRVLGRVAVAGHPESFQLESSGPRMFVNVPTARQIAVIDRKAMNVTATWPVTAAGANYPMALDESGHRLFIGCRRPAKALIYDTQTGKQIGAADIAGDTDDLFYDAAVKRLYVIGGEGFIDVLDAQASSSPTRVAHVSTAAGARTGLFVAALHRLFLAVPHRGTQAAEIRVYETRS